MMSDVEVRLTAWNVVLTHGTLDSAPAVAAPLNMRA